MPGGGQVSLGLWEVTPTPRPVLCWYLLWARGCQMLEDKCMSYYDHFTDGESEVWNWQVPHSKSPGQQATELWCAHKPCSDTSSAYIP